MDNSASRISCHGKLCAAKIENSYLHLHKCINRDEHILSHYIRFFELRENVVGQLAFSFLYFSSFTWTLCQD